MSMELNQNNIIQEIEKQAILKPNKTALISVDKEISFLELEQYSNKIANYLISKKLTGSNIGISLNRSPEIIIAILGVLKAGCAYVFLDPKYPSERIKYILENSDIKLLITSGLKHKVFSCTEIYRISIDNIYAEIHSTVNPELNVDSKSRAYIMYTSGSTGKPKGVEISHANIISYVRAIIPLFDITEDDIYLHTASFSFSSSIRQFFVPLFYGIPVYIANEEEVVSLFKILEVVKKRNISIIDSIPSLWKYGLNQIERLNIYKRKSLLNSTLRLLIFSGDMLPAKLIQKVKVVFQNKLKIINVCGQTESIGMMAYHIPDDFTDNSGTVPIGFPLSNTSIKVLDEELKPVKNGEIGELYILSPSVGIGYYNNQVLTNKVFSVDIIFRDTPYKTLKTGDLVRYWKEKPIEIIGRTDFQVKIRGIRIDVSEVENVILNYPLIKECIVIGKPNEEDENILVCFVVTKDNVNLNINQLKHYLKGIVSENFIPEKILFIKKIPVSSNGKVDRKKLLSIAESEVAPTGQLKSVEFKNEIQKNLFNLFGKILNSRNFTITDNFFDIGGHSLKALELVEILERIYNKNIPLELIYKYPSIEKLAPEIEVIKAESYSTNLVALNTSESTNSLFCVHGDDANFLLPKYLREDISFYGFFHQGRNGDRIEYTEINSISQKYIEELIQFKPHGPYIIGGYSIGGVIAYEMAKQIRDRGQEINLLILIDSESPHYKGKRVPGKNSFSEGNVKVEVSEKKSLITRLQSAINSKFNRSAFYLALLLQKFRFKVPPSLRNQYIMGVYRRARNNYDPGTSDVKTVLIRSTTDNFEDRNLGWDRYINGGFNTYEIDSDHDTIIKEPRVRELAKIIQEAIICNS
jgi:amino acid adenylation domain-containing protein